MACGRTFAKERNRTDANGTGCPVFMEFMVVMPGSKKQGKKRTGYSLSDTRLAFVPLGTQDTDPADRSWLSGWERWLDMAFASTTVFWKILEEKTKICSCLGEDPSGADHRKRSMDGPCMCSFSYRTWGNRALEKAMLLLALD